MVFSHVVYLTMHAARKLFSSTAATTTSTEIDVAKMLGGKPKACKVQASQTTNYQASHAYAIQSAI